MVVYGGLHPFSGTLEIRDSVDQIVQNFETMRLLANDTAEMTELLFLQIKKKCKTEIDFLCVIFESDYLKTFRKKFIQLSKNYGIHNIQIIDLNVARLIGAVKVLTMKPKYNTFLYIFDIFNDKINCLIWKANDEEEWQFVKRENKMLSQNWEGEIECLESFKVDSNNDKHFAFIYCQQNKADANLLQNSTFKNINFYDIHNFSGFALDYACYMSGNKDYLHYKCQLIFECHITVTHNDVTIINTDDIEKLPYEKCVNLPRNGNQKPLKIYESEEFSQTFPFYRLKMFFLNIDLNGVYEMHYEHDLETKIVHNTYDLATEVLISDMSEIFFEDFTKKSYNIPVKSNEYKAEFDAVGIDLGTSTCCAAVIRRNGAEFVPLDSLTSNRTMPSFVIYDDAHEKCGQIAVNRIKNKSQFIVFDSKRMLGKTFDEIVTDPSWPFKILKEENGILVELANSIITKSPEEISGALLNHIKLTLDTFQGRHLREAVITIPSTFNTNQIASTLKAAKIGGWENIHFIPEPVAAAFAYLTKTEIQNNSKIFLFDFGGGTIDVCVAEIRDQQLKVLSYDGDAYLGGQDYDTLLFNYFHGILKNKFRIDVMKSNRKFILMQKCTEIKCTLSTVNESWLDINDYDAQNEDDTIPITMNDFEKMAEAYQNRITKVILQSLEKIKLQKNDINYVFEVGGGCRMPMIKKLLSEIFPDAIHERSSHPEELVAHGAALYAYYLKTVNMAYAINDCIDHGNNVYEIPSKELHFDSHSNVATIDFGTTQCYAAVVRDMGVDTVSLGNTGSRELPSYVGFDENEPKCGQIVIYRMRHYAKSTVFDVKLFMGKKYEEIVINPAWPFKIIKEDNNIVKTEVENRDLISLISPEEVAAIILSHIKAKMEEFKGRPLPDVVITVPFNFTLLQKQSLYKAAKIAQWETIHFLPEPVAAVFKCLFQNEIKNDSNILIFDFGGGSTNVCMAKIENKQIKILCHENDAYLGGRNFDNVLFNHFNAILKYKYNIDLSKEKEYKLLRECQSIKESLSQRTEVIFDVENFDFNTEEFFEIKRSEFETIAADLLLRTKGLILRTIANSRLQIKDISYVLPLGGGYQMPMIRNLITEIFPNAETFSFRNPDEIIATGAALYAYNLH